MISQWAPPLERTKLCAIIYAGAQVTFSVFHPTKKHFHPCLMANPWQVGKTHLALYSSLVPHSQSSLRENPKFLQNFRHKNNTIKANFK
jgi:hypothetical protein